MATHKFPFSPAPYRKVRNVQFGILSPEEIKNMAALVVKYPNTFEGGVPKREGLADQRMGTLSDRDYPCFTCENDQNECSGHFGCIELVKPVFHIGFFSTTIRVLRSVCFHCSKLKADKNNPKYKKALKLPPKDRLSAMYRLAGTESVCDNSIPDPNSVPEGTYTHPHGGCGSSQPKISRSQLRLTAQFDGNVSGIEKKKELTAEEVHSILKNISDEDALALGFDPEFSRPDWMVLTVLAVPPPQVRPSVIVNGQGKGEDDLTFKLADIIKVNNQIRRHEDNSAPAHIIKEFTSLLQFHVATYMNNEIPGQPQATQKSGRPLKSIYQRIKGKEGRVRGNLMGKRVDFSARSVITGDPNVSCTEVGVPSVIATKLTYPEIVTPFNLTRMQDLVVAGPEQHPGALYVIHENGDRDDLRHVKERRDIHLSMGDRVERHLCNGDYVIFNRQPSLHKMSMMGHKVKIMPYSTFRLNLSCTSPYNADFDGDEMNLHAPQNVETRAEIAEIMLVPHQIITPQANKPVIGLVQDTLLGASLLTRRDTFLRKEDVMNLLMWLPQWDGKIPIPAILAPEELWTGKQIFSLVIPQITLTGTSKVHDKKEPKDFFSPRDTQVFIDRGEIVSGIIDSASVGKSSGGVIHLIWLDYGPHACAMFIDTAQFIVTNWLTARGYTIGIGDTIADAKTMQRINETIKSAKDTVRHHIIDLHHGKLEAKPGMTLNETFEQAVNAALNDARDHSGNFASGSLDRHNNIKTMVDGGSKGSFINIAQIIACVGQQNVEASRIPFGFQRRTLPHFNKDDQSPEARGFVENSYLRGLTPQEFFFHAMGGREGLIDTAVKTSSTGYIQRRLVKAMEDVRVHYDGTVRNSKGEIIQFIYGEDGMDAIRLEFQTLESYKMNRAQLTRTYQWDFTSPTLGLQDGILTQEVIEEIRSDPAAQDLLAEEFDLIERELNTLKVDVFPDGDSGRWPLPVNIKRLVLNAQKAHHIDPNKSIASVSPSLVVTKVNEVLASLIVVPGEDLLSVEAQRNATLLFKIHLHSMLGSRRVIEEYRLNEPALHWVLGEIKRGFMRSIVAPGESIGALAAQSIGQPATQMTLNTFHYAGVSSMSATRGIPRLVELINVAKEIKTPSMTIFLPEDTRSDFDAAKAALRKIEHTTLEKVIAKTEIWYDPDPKNTVVDADEEFISLFWLTSADVSHQLSPWSLRLEFDTSRMIDLNLTLEFIGEQIEKHFTGVHVIHSDENSPNLVMTVRLRDSERQPGDKVEDDDTALELLQQVETIMLAEVPLQGISGINKVLVKKEQTIYTVDEVRGWADSEERQLLTEGSALVDVLSQPPGLIDPTRTFCNDIVEILQVLGIEACRQALFLELQATLGGGGGSYVNYRHLATLSDIMTYRGYLLAVTRHGINRRGTGPLMRCSFEETVDMLMEAAMYAENDKLRGVSENIILGNLAPLGTASFELLLNAEMLQSAVEIPQERYTNYSGESRMAPGTPGHTMDPWNTPGREVATPGSMSPIGSPLSSPSMSPMFSPAPSPGSPMTPGSPFNSPGGYSPARSPGYSPASPGYSPASPGYSPASPGYSPASPGYSPASPGYSPASPGYSPASPGYSPASPGYSPGHSGYSPASPAYSPASPGYSPASPGYSPSSPAYSPSSPAYSPSSPAYSPSSPKMSPSIGGSTSPAYSPSSPQYSPSSPQYSPSSPQYSPSSPQYSPSSPQYSPSSPQYSPSSPQYSPSSPQYSPSSPQYSPSSPQYSPSSPQYSPSSPQYSPSSPQYSPSSPQYSPSSPQYSPSSPQYSPSSPQYK